MATWRCARVQEHAITSTRPSGGMADTTDSKSVARKGVRVQIPPRAPTDQHLHATPVPLGTGVVTRGHKTFSETSKPGALIARISVAVLLP